jgi:hypothetical protein
MPVLGTRVHSYRVIPVGKAEDCIGDQEVIFSTCSQKKMAVAYQMYAQLQLPAQNLHSEKRSLFSSGCVMVGEQ